MKLQKELPLVIETFNKNLERIKEYASVLKESGNYNDFNTRLAFDCLRAFVGTKTMCSWYEKYNCTDAHIKTLGIKALKELNII
jgi:hypothetical protein